MWGTVAVFALGAAVDPGRLGIAVLLVSRPRPMVKLFAFWLGGMAGGAAAALGVFILMRDFALMVAQTVSAAAASSTTRHIEIAVGVLALLIAGVIARRPGAAAHYGSDEDARESLWARLRGRIPTLRGDASVLVLQGRTRTAFSRFSARAEDLPESRSLLVAFTAGLGMALPPVEYAAAITSILASGVGAGAQVSAALMFTVVSFLIVEIPLVSHLAKPARTQAVTLQLYTWMRGRRRQIAAAVTTVLGAMLLAAGMGSL